MAARLSSSAKTDWGETRSLRAGAPPGGGPPRLGARPRLAAGGPGRGFRARLPAPGLARVRTRGAVPGGRPVPWSGSVIGAGDRPGPRQGLRSGRAVPGAARARPAARGRARRGSASLRASRRAWIRVSGSGSSGLAASGRQDAGGRGARAGQRSGAGASGPDRASGPRLGGGDPVPGSTAGTWPRLSGNSTRSSVRPATSSRATTTSKTSRSISQ